MKLQDQVITIEQAKRLKELGIIQKSLFYHHPAFDRPVFGEQWTTQHGKRYTKSMVCNDKKGSAAAFTVAELGAMLPNHYPSWRFPVPAINEEKWIATVICSPKPPGIDDIHTAHEFDRMGDTQAQALGTLLIALLVTEVITPDEANTRLSN